ncbi:MAG: VOC family protein [Bacteroidota bacterium]
MSEKRAIDHIVYVIPNLEEAIDRFEQQSGVRPVFGGYHTTQGTKNAIVNLGDACYLEFLATDEENHDVQPPRWMGVDLITTPKITRWSLKSSDLGKDSEILKNYNPSMGVVKGGQRNMTNGQLLTWEMSMPLAEPEVEIIPFLTNWQYSDIHPSEPLPEQCHLLRISAVHPDPNSLYPVLNYFYPEFELTQAEQVSLSIEIQTPNGVLYL